MIWLTWRQFRAQAWVALAVLAVAAVALAVTGPSLVRMFDASGIAGCAARGDCGPLEDAFFNQVGRDTTDNILFHLGPMVLFAVPSLIGMFWGAPLVTREFETGSFRMVWNQSVTRTRWLAVKLVLIGLASMATVGLLSLADWWWSSPVERVRMLRMTPGTFGGTGIMPVGYAAFAFVVGVTAGILIRRTLPAMAVTLAVTGGVQAFVSEWLPGRLVAPVRGVFPFNGTNGLGGFAVMPRTGQFVVYMQPPNIPGAWMLSGLQTITTTDHTVGQACLQALAKYPGAPPAACIAAIARLHLTEAVSYQPLSHYWTLQWYETAILLAAALALAAFCLWRVARQG